MRQSLLKSQKIKNYLIYAFGEVLLIVIGILLAMQLSTWNQKRMMRQQEKLLLEEMHEEFIYNKAEFEGNKNRYEEVLFNLDKIIDLFPINLKLVEKDSLAAYLERVHFTGNFDYSNTSLQKIKSVNSIDIISDKELRDLLFTWEILLMDWLEEENLAIKYLQDVFNPELAKQINRPYEAGISDPRVNWSYFNSILFEGLIINRSRTVKNLLYRLQQPPGPNNQNIIQVMDRIIALSGKE